MSRTRQFRLRGPMRQYFILFVLISGCAAGEHTLAPQSPAQGQSDYGHYPGSAPSPSKTESRGADSWLVPVAPWADRAPGDDIRMGLRKSAELVKGAPGLSVAWESTEKRIAERDLAMRRLAEFLREAPRTAQIECLVGDVYHSAHGLGDRYDHVRLYSCELLSEKVGERMAELGFARVGTREWNSIRSLARQASERAETALFKKVFDLEEILVISYYDGRCWHIAPWYYLSLVPSDREVRESDLAVFDFLGHLNRKLDKGITFTDFYNHHLLSDPVFREEYAEMLRRSPVK